MPAVNRLAAWDWRLVVPVVLLLVAVEVVVGAAAATNPWPVAGFAVALLTVVLLLSSGRALFLTVFVVKPFIDMLWFAGWRAGDTTLNAQSVVSVCVFVVATVILVIRRVELPKGLFIAVATFMASNAVALLLTPSLPRAIDGAMSVVCALPLVFVVPTLVAELPAPKRLLRMFLVVVGIVYVTILLQPLGLLAYRSFDSGGIQRATGLYYHPWDVARYLVVAMPLLLVALADKSTFGAERWAYRALFLATVAVTYFTFLKMAWIAVLVEVLLWFVLTRQPRKALLIGALVVLIVAFPARDFVFTVFGDLGKLGSTETRGQALSGRVTIWEGYLAGLRDASPEELLIGQGFEPASMVKEGAMTHNDYLRVLVMNGIVGFVAYVALIVVAMRVLLQSVGVLSRKRGTEWRIGVAVGCMFAAYLLMGVTADTSSYPSLTLYLWLLLGLVRGYAQREAAESRFAPAMLDAHADRPATLGDRSAAFEEIW